MSEKEELQKQLLELKQRLDALEGGEEEPADEEKQEEPRKQPTREFAVPEQVFFYELKNGEIVAVSEKEAVGLEKRGLTQIGVSDGVAYAEKVNEANGDQAAIRKAFKEEIELARGNTRAPQEKKLLHSNTGLVTEANVRNFQ